MNLGIRGQSTHRSMWILPVILGLFAFTIVVGWSVVNPENIAWLAIGDPAQHFLGWQFFRSAPWSFPLGLNPNFGLELSNSIVFSDSNPLLAIFFKLWSPILPETFQYFGLWLLACFILQAWFGWKLVGLVSQKVLVRILGTGFFVFSPPFIWRLHGHLSLCGHFLILAALYLVLHPSLDKRKVKWGILLAVTALVHAYLFAMVGALWLADMAGKLIARKLSLNSIFTELLIITPITGMLCWQAGYFSVGEGTTLGGFGYFRMNLFSVIDPMGWSNILRDIQLGAGDYEGFNFLGLGMLFLWVMTLPYFIDGKTRSMLFAKKNIALVLTLACLSLFALSNNIGIALFNISYGLPDIALKIASVFRASGRMFWPVYYCIFLGAISVVIHKYSHKVSAGCLAICLTIQVLDTSAGWQSLQANLRTVSAPTWHTALLDPFWAKAGGQYRKLKLIKPINNSEHWQMLAYYASTYHLATNTIYLARIGNLEYQKAQEDALKVISTGKYNPDTLYILDEASVAKVAILVDKNKDMLSLIDGLYVLAPGWKECKSCLPAGTEAEISAHSSPVIIGKPMFFSSTTSGQRNLLSGWMQAESWGTWSEGGSAELYLPISNQASSIHIEANALVTPSHPYQIIETYLDGIFVQTDKLTKSSENFIDLQLPKNIASNLIRGGGITVKFIFKNAASPQEMGMNVNDLRKISIGLISITVQ